MGPCLFFQDMKASPVDQTTKIIDSDNNCEFLVPAYQNYDLYDGGVSEWRDWHEILFAGRI